MKNEPFHGGPGGCCWPSGEHRVPRGTNTCTRCGRMVGSVTTTPPCEEDEVQPVEVRLPDAATYHLGHYETMQMALALRNSVEEFEALDPEDRTEEWQLADADTIKYLARMFTQPDTTVSITITHQKD